MKLTTICLWCILASVAIGAGIQEQENEVDVDEKSLDAIGQAVQEDENGLDVDGKSFDVRTDDEIQENEDDEVDVDGKSLDVRTDDETLQEYKDEVDMDEKTLDVRKHAGNSYKIRNKLHIVEITRKNLVIVKNFKENKCFVQFSSADSLCNQARAPRRVVSKYIRTACQKFKILYYSRTKCPKVRRQPCCWRRIYRYKCRIVGKKWRCGWYLRWINVCL